MNTEKLVRDHNSNAVINTDMEEYQKHKMEVQKNRLLREKLVELNNLKKDVTEIKDLLQSLVNGLSKNG